MINPRTRFYREPGSELDPTSVEAQLLDMIGSGKRILEIGCSSARMSRLLVERNCRVTSIEGDAAIAADAGAYSEEVIVADLDTRALPDLLPRTTFDIALFADVLVRLRDPWRVLDEARSFLAPGSYALISLPNVAHESARLSLLRGAFEYAAGSVFDPSHVRFFTSRSLRELCLRSGYRIDELRRSKAGAFEGAAPGGELGDVLCSPQVLEQIRSDPEHDTVAFVVKAAPLDDREKFSLAVGELLQSEDLYRRLSEKHASLERDLERLQTSLRNLEAAAREAEVRAAAHQLESDESFKSEIAFLREALQAATSEREAAEARISEQRAEFEFEIRALADAEAAARRALRSRVQQLETALEFPLGQNVPGPAYAASAARPGESVDAGSRLWAAQIDLLNLFERMHVERLRRLENGGYDEWRRLHAVRAPDVPRLRELAKLLPMRPLISVVVATYETPEPFLRQAIESVRNQAYPYWELCIADDASQSPHVRSILSDYAALDSRIRVVFREENGHISKATNSALELARGEFVGFLDHDDLLAPDALLEVAIAVNREPGVDMLYSDEDKVDQSGRHCEPHFKPDWCPESYLSRNYTCHFGVYRRSLIETVGGLRAGFEGSQDYDLVLRISELTDRIVHIPKVLYHWRMHSGSTSSLAEAKPYAYDAAVKALGEALERRGEPGRIEQSPGAPGVYLVRYTIRNPKRVTVIVLARDDGDRVDRCLNSIFKYTGYADLEVLVVQDGHTGAASERAVLRWELSDSRVKVLRSDVPSNYSKLNNSAAEKASGDYLLFLSSEVEVASSGWIEAMVEQAQRPPIGAVGALLLYQDDTVHHAGVLVGVGEVAAHAFQNVPASSAGYCAMIRAVDNYSAVSAACMMLRREAFEKAGGFDETLAVAFSDVDLCLQLGRKGYRNVYLPHVVAHYFESKSRGVEDTLERVGRSSREVTTMKRRWGTMTYLDPCYNPNLSREFADFRLCDENERWASVLDKRFLDPAAVQ